jgi:hypothetical protein
MKAALEAWGASSNLFHQIADTMEKQATPSDIPQVSGYLFVAAGAVSSLFSRRESVRGRRVSHHCWLGYC